MLESKFCAAAIFVLGAKAKFEVKSKDNAVPPLGSLPGLLFVFAMSL